MDAPDLLAQGLQREGHEILATVSAGALALAAQDLLLADRAEALLSAVTGADAIVLEVRRDTVSVAVVGMCDRAGTRIVPLCADAADERLVHTFGLEHPLPAGAEAWLVSDALTSAPRPVPGRSPGADPQVIAVWGPMGSPGRSTVAIELALELARGGRHVGLVDADVHAPSIALALGLADEGPGFAAACRQAGLGGLDPRELARVSTPLGRTGVDVLTGLNRPGRWPELTDERVTGALRVCRDWADYVVVDVAAPLERDEEIVSDLDGPRRNAATLAALRSADLVVAVAAAEPVGIARFLRGHAELREVVGATPVAVLANRLRPATLGVDARGQVRRTLDRFGGIRDVWFLPHDARSADAALLAARPIAVVSPKSSFTLALRRFVGEAVVGSPAGPGDRPARGLETHASRRDGRTPRRTERRSRRDGRAEGAAAGV